VNAPVRVSSSFALDLSDRGYHVLFHRDEANRCPGCGNSRWLVGRVTAECASCGSGLPLAKADHARFDLHAQKAVALHVVEASRPPEAGTEKRSEERVPVEGQVLALILDGSPHSFSVRNQSAGGLMGDMVPGLAEARSIMVELEDGTLVPAELKWTDGAKVGVAFVKPTRRKLRDFFGLKSGR